jgi:ADP-ribose pyrophosphatase
MTNELVWQGRWMEVRKIDGWEYVTRTNKGVVAVFPVWYAPDGTIMTTLVSQFRKPLQRNVMAMVAGLVDAGETAEDAARRELLEEAGLIADQLIFVGEFPSSSGLTDETVKVYRAPFCAKTTDKNWKPDVEEGIVVHDIPVSNLLRDLQTFAAAGFMLDSKIFAALYTPTKDQ